jgi:hypothetical protein
MPTMYSCHDPHVKLPPQDPAVSILRNVPHICQKSNWDCGVAAIAMLCAYTMPKFYDPTTAYRATLTCLGSIVPALCVPNTNSGAPAIVQVDERGEESATLSSDGTDDSLPVLNGLWTVHLVLALRQLLETPLQHILVPHTFSTTPSGQLVELSREEKEDIEGAGATELDDQQLLLGSPADDLVALREEISASPNVQISFFSTYIGVNPQHIGEAYYADTLASDTEHVASAFAELQELQQRHRSRIVVNVQKRLVTTRDLIEIMQEEESGDAELIFLCLVDGSKLHCRCHQSTTWLGAAWSLLGYAVGLGGYMGHYVVVCGYDKATDQVLYRNPGVAAGDIAGTGYLCAESVDTFEAARSADGTDYDTVLLRLC